MTPDLIRATAPPPANLAHLASVARQHSSRPPVPSVKASSAAGQSLWSTYWQDFAAENQPHERCFVPGDGRHLVDAHWEGFADDLASGAQVIDLACGAGVVGHLLLRRRSDLRVTGIDWADVPLTALPNLTIHRGVSMEALPFGDSSFDAAVSLFGVEYGDLARTAPELARVLKPGARFNFFVHHAESEILREGSTRRRALREVLSGTMKAVFLGGRAAGVEQQRQWLTNRFPGEPSLKLIGDYLKLNVASARPERHLKWQSLADGFAPEIALLAQLERAAKSAAGMGPWLTPLLSEMRSVSVAVLRRRSGEPIAWEVGGTR